LPFAPAWLSSVSDPCPYPSCLCLPLRTSFYRFSLIFSPRGRRCVVRSVLAYFHEKCNRVTSSDGMNFSEVSRCLPVFGYFLAQRIHLSNFYVKHNFSCFRKKFGDQSTLTVVDFRLEERIKEKTSGRVCAVAGVIRPRLLGLTPNKPRLSMP
jgi:hypothetical protein